MNIYQIKKAVLEANPGNLFFSRGAMKLAKQTLKDFRVLFVRQYRYLIYAYNKNSKSYTRRIFDSQSNTLCATQLEPNDVKSWSVK